MPKFLLGRRQFALGVAAAATSTLALPGKAVLGKTLPGDLLSQPAASVDQSTDAQSLDKKTRAAMAKLSPSAQAEVEMKVASIFRKYGDRLSDEQKADIRRIMAESQEGLEKMRAFKLENGDQPADAFRAYRIEEHSGAKPAQAKPRSEKK
ncbi:MAG TPA: hypothetical protein VF938_08750 [Candidatus Angelobacter sp.]